MQKIKLPPRPLPMKQETLTLTFGEPQPLPMKQPKRQLSEHDQRVMFATAFVYLAMKGKNE